MVNVKHILIGMQNIRKKGIVYMKSNRKRWKASFMSETLPTDTTKENKYCLRCGRRLRNPEARILGYGKICYSKIKDIPHKKKLFTPN
jgi:hypothetical protein